MFETPEFIVNSYLFFDIHLSVMGLSSSSPMFDLLFDLTMIMFPDSGFGQKCTHGINSAPHEKCRKGVQRWGGLLYTWEVKRVSR